MKIQEKLMVLLCVLFLVACKEQNNKVAEQQAPINPTPNIVAEDSITELPRIVQKTIYEDKNHRIYLEKAGGEVYCYADSQRVVFHDDYMDLGAMAMFFHRPANSRYIYIVGDIVPNSDGWTVRFHLYRMDKHTFSVKHIGNFAGIRFESNGFKAATTKLLNPDAECTADERFAVRDNHYNYDGMLLRKGEYYDDMEKEYSEELINAEGFPYGSYSVSGF